MHTKYHKARTVSSLHPRTSPTIFRRRLSAFQLVTSPASPSHAYSRLPDSDLSSSSPSSSQSSWVTTPSPRQRHAKSCKASSSSRSSSPAFDLPCAPAYSDDSPPVYGSIETAAARQPATPNKLTKLVLGKARARKVAVQKAQKKARRTDDAHAAWAAVGVDTRSALARGEALPPHFFHAPRCSPFEGMEAAIKREFGL